MRLTGIILVSLALSGASVTAFNGINNFVERQQRAAEDLAFERLKLRHDQARSSCRGDDRCILTTMYPDRDDPPGFAHSAPVRTDVLRAGAVLSLAERE